MKCACGCGRETTLCKANNATRGLVKGVPNRFVLGHRLRVAPEEHPRWRGGLSGAKARRVARPLISADHLRALLSYDPDTGVFTWRVNRRPRAVIGQAAGSRSNADGYTNICIDGHRYKGHRLAWLYVHGAWPGRHIDHANGDRRDNRIANLRLATPSQNLANSRLRKDNRSGYKGVSPFEGKWMANVNKDGVNHYLGLFESPEAAHAAYIAKAQELHGEFARSR